MISVFVEVGGQGLELVLIPHDASFEVASDLIREEVDAQDSPLLVKYGEMRLKFKASTWEVYYQIFLTFIEEDVTLSLNFGRLCTPLKNSALFEATYTFCMVGFYELPFIALSTSKDKNSGWII